MLTGYVLYPFSDIHLLPFDLALEILNGLLCDLGGLQFMEFVIFCGY